MEVEKMKRIIESIDADIFGVNIVKIKSFKKLGIGEGNINYIFTLENEKFICRINLDMAVLEKSEREYDSLKIIESLKIAPKVYFLHKKNKIFKYDFIILDFIEGKVWRHRKRTYTNNQIKQFAQILAELHNIKPKGMKKEYYFFDSVLKRRSQCSRRINKFTKDRNKKLLDNLEDAVKFKIPKKIKYKFGLIHGDICPQNIVETKDKKLKLIDWESLRFSEPAKDVANVLTDLRLSEKNLKLFISTYQKYRIDNDILERAKTYALLNRYANVVWEILMSFEIINKKLP
ncbi:MAG: aminoglycoside phosphotransferase family protein, partial [archaeon]